MAEISFTQYQMVFASLVFLCVFLPLNLVLYYLFKNGIYRNVLLIIFSLFFYAWGEPVWIVLLLLTTLVDYSNARLIEKWRSTRWAKLPVAASVVFNFGILIAFKYSGFITDNINAILGTQLQVPGFSLPIGISFYTFQSISYVIDVYRGEVPAQKAYYKYLLFVSLFHQLVAGPIVRYVDIANEIDNRKVDWKDISSGFSRFCLGLFKKVFFANNAGEIATRYLDGDLSALTTGSAWFGLVLFSLQIYFDFSGYSDMAIGMGRMIGFHYLENFRFPYIARSATEFWRRWHISLGSFFRDYVYIPLGGNRKRAFINLFIVWFLTGMWHGASWNFILWGLYFGFLIAIERLFLAKILEKAGRAVGHAYLLFAAVLGWSLFYFTDFFRLQKFVSLLFGKSGVGHWDLDLKLTFFSNLWWLVFAVAFCLPIKPWVEQLMAKQHFRVQRLADSVLILLNLSMLLISISLLVGQSYNPFLYFRF